MSQTPLPCPFCASPDVHVNGIGQQVVRCMDCRAEGPAVTPLDPRVQAVLRRKPCTPVPTVMRELVVRLWNSAVRRDDAGQQPAETCASRAAAEACAHG